MKFEPWRRSCQLEPQGQKLTMDLPSGNLTAIENGPFIVDLPTKNGDFQQLC